MLCPILEASREYVALMANIAIVIQSRLNAAVATNPVGVIDKRKATFADLLMSNPALHLQAK